MREEEGEKTVRGKDLKQGGRRGAGQRAYSSTFLVQAVTDLPQVVVDRDIPAYLGFDPVTFSD